MKSILLALLATGSIALTGCVPINTVSYNYKPPKSMGGRRCIVRCDQNRLICERNNQHSYDHCERRADRSAKYAYHAYVMNQRRSHQPVHRNFNDFKEDWSCSLNSGVCTDRYRQCYSICGGEVIKHSKCIAFCKKPK